MNSDLHNAWQIESPQTKFLHWVYLISTDNQHPLRDMARSYLMTPEPTPHSQREAMSDRIEPIFAAAITNTLWQEASEIRRAAVKDMESIFLDHDATADERQAAVSTAIMGLERPSATEAQDL